jgi:hypothetical protein
VRWVHEQVESRRWWWQWRWRWRWRWRWWPQAFGGRRRLSGGPRNPAAAAAWAAPHSADPHNLQLRGETTTIPFPLPCGQLSRACLGKPSFYVWCFKSTTRNYLKNSNTPFFCDIILFRSSIFTHRGREWRSISPLPHQNLWKISTPSCLSFSCRSARLRGERNAPPPPVFFCLPSLTRVFRDETQCFTKTGSGRTHLKLKTKGFLHTVMGRLMTWMCSSKPPASLRLT